MSSLQSERIEPVFCAGDVSVAELLCFAWLALKRHTRATLWAWKWHS